ncbi:MAG TPA: hypothetical protein VG477_17275 [Thermoanaerobaculia bacterium]|nr:hypothetical protein [Thermoanaerobaculia bacterium]
MRNHFARGLALLALSAAAPLAAETLYVPVVEPLLRDGSRLSAEMQFPREAKVTGTENGLVVIEGVLPSAVEARIETAHGNLTFLTGVPVISAANRIAANGAAYLNGLTGNHRDIVSLDLANLAGTKATCKLELLRDNGSPAGTIPGLEVQALSTRSFENALGLGLPPGTVGIRASCDQDFYAYAVGIDRETREVSFSLPSAAASPAPYERQAVAPSGKRTIVVTRSGDFHFATRADPKGKIGLPVPGEIVLKQVKSEFDVTVGPWSKRQVDGNHGLLWLHRGKFRPHTLCSVNAQGPKKNGVKINQNLDLPVPPDVTSSVGRLTWERGKTYRVSVLYDAPAKSLVLRVSQDGHLLRTLLVPGTAKNGEIPVSRNGLFAEFGHFMDQELPAVGAPGWKFSNFRAEMIEK